jgi:hypothetical protein
MMEKQIVRWSYWLGLACAAVAIVLRGLIFAGLWHPVTNIQDGWHMSFFKGAVLLLLISLATSAYAWSEGKK